MSGSPPSPNWDAQNLTAHHQRRLAEDPGCFEELIGTTGTMTEQQYELRSCDAVENAWAEYEGRSRDVAARRWRETAAYFVDDQLVVAITDTFRRAFITCYHEHFNGSHAATMTIGSVGQRQIRYRQHLQFDIDTDQFVMERRLRGV